MSGVCKNGDNCRFSHDWSSEPNMICRYYLAGSCVYGDNCRYDHVKPGNQTQQASGYVPPQIPKPQIDEQDGAQKKGSTLNLNAKEWQQNPDTAVYDDQYEFNEDEFYADGDEFYEGEEFDPWNEEGGDQLPPDPAELPLCTEYLVVGHCQRDEDCPFIHGDFCEICQKYAIHPYNEEQQIEQNVGHCFLFLRQSWSNSKPTSTEFHKQRESLTSTQTSCQTESNRHRLVGSRYLDQRFRSSSWCYCGYWNSTVLYQP
eukprot:TRINITY_DN6469_c0_g2_i2.p1 TRINITY_DN6469_c0_g2~~TRINITY_DN6469_c0_g2_i2.p1  ORF type:complete len:300 (+),score=10.66 TRINITY_DN6469_c0_g2_i2:129-902(+)